MCYNKDIRRAKEMEIKMIYDLSAQYDARNSFYGKAHVLETPEGEYLKSYNTIVAFIPKGGKPVVYGTYSNTTLRHIKEFLRQNGFRALNIDEIRKLIHEGVEAPVI
jgi:hypothetical protein